MFGRQRTWLFTCSKLHKLMVRRMNNFVWLIQWTSMFTNMLNHDKVKQCQHVTRGFLLIVSMVLQWELKLPGVEMKMRPGCGHSHSLAIRHTKWLQTLVLFTDWPYRKPNKLQPTKEPIFLVYPIFFLPDLVYFSD